MGWERDVALGEYVREMAWDDIIPNELDDIVQEFYEDILNMIKEMFEEKKRKEEIRRMLARCGIKVL